MNQEIPQPPPQESLADYLKDRSTIGIVSTGDRVIIRQFTPEEKIGSIIIPTMGQEPPNMGIVVAVGDGKLIESAGYRIPPQFVLGTKVFFGKYAGAEIILQRKEMVKEKINGVDTEYEKTFDDSYLIMREDEVMAVDLREGVAIESMETK